MEIPGNTGGASSSSEPSVYEVATKSLIKDDPTKLLGEALTLCGQLRTLIPEETPSGTPNAAVAHLNQIIKALNKVHYAIHELDFQFRSAASSCNTFLQLTDLLMKERAERMEVLGLEDTIEE